MNKKLLLIIAVILSMSLLVACGEKKEEAPTSPVVVINDSGDKEVVVSRAVETDPYKANIPNEIFDFYLEKVTEIEASFKKEQAQLLAENPDMDLSTLTKLKYDLVFFDDNNIPEMVVTREGRNTRLYTYDAGKVLYAMNDEYTISGDESGWPFGAGGNNGYEYIPRANTMRNINSDMAGLIRYFSYYKLDENTHNLVNMYEDSICEYHFNDKNGNGEIDDDENSAENYTTEATAYFLGEKEITAKEAKDYMVVSEDYEILEGKKTAEEFKAKLDSLVNEK